MRSPSTQPTDHRRDEFPDDLTMAFQPIYSAQTGKVFAYEALVRLSNGGDATSAMAKITEDNCHSFDRKCQFAAVRLAKRLGLTSRLSINLLTTATVDPDLVMRTSERACAFYGFPVQNLIFEIKATDFADDPERVGTIIDRIHSHGASVALDDFTPTALNLALLEKAEIDIVKVDTRLTGPIGEDNLRCSQLRALMSLTRNNKTEVVIEGVETRREFQVLAGLGANLFQGFLLGRPLLRRLRDSPAIRLPMVA